jgi:hypothetical protein
VTPQELEAVQRFVDFVVGSMTPLNVNHIATCCCHDCLLMRFYRHLQTDVPGIK